MTRQLDLKPRHRERIERLLRAHLPDVEVWAYGSRVNRRSHEGSDLDLVLRGPGLAKIDTTQLAAFNEAVQESTIPFRVEARDWARLPESFHREIERGYVVLVGKEEQSVDGGWRTSTWGAEISLEYGKGIRGYAEADGLYRVFGSNGPVGWTNKPLAPGPGVILGRKGAYRGVEYSPDPFFVIDTAYYVKPKTNLNMRWLYYAIKHHKLGEIDDGSPIPSTTRAAVYARDLDIPPLPEQRAIAHILGALDDKIELNRRMNETLEGMARALFKSWFIDFDPVHAKATLKHHAANQVPRQGDSAQATEAARSRITSPQGGSDWTAERARTHLDNLGQNIADLFPDSVADDGPIGWGRRTLYEIAEFANGATYKNMHFSPEREGLPVVKIAELKHGVTASTKFTKTELGEKYRINAGEILFSWSGNPDTSIDTFIWNDSPAWLNQHIFRVRENGSATRALIYFQLKQLKPVLSEIARNKQTTGLGHITARDMKELMVCDPPKPVVDAFEEIAGPMFLRIIANLIENQALARTRDLLLPKLMSGELRMGV